MAGTIRRPLPCPERGVEKTGEEHERKIEQKESKKSKGKKKR